MQDDSLKTETSVVLLQHELQGLREQQKAHASETRETLGNISATMKTMNEWLIRNEKIPIQVEELYTFHQRQKGFLNAARIFTGAIGGGIAFIIEQGFNFFHK